jgi:hypothetical protein
VLQLRFPPPARWFPLALAVEPAPQELVTEAPAVEAPQAIAPATLDAEPVVVEPEASAASTTTGSAATTGSTTTGSAVTGSMVAGSTVTELVTEAPAVEAPQAIAPATLDAEPVVVEPEVVETDSLRRFDSRRFGDQLLRRWLDGCWRDTLRSINHHRWKRRLSLKRQWKPSRRRRKPQLKHRLSKPRLSSEWRAHPGAVARRFRDIIRRWRTGHWRGGMAMTRHHFLKAKAPPAVIAPPIKPPLNRPAHSPSSKRAK